MNTLATLDRNRLTPYTVGFDSLFDRLFDTDFHTTSGGFPPYNIVKNDDYNYQIEMALAGYSKKDIDIELKEGNLTISSKKLEEEIDENTTMVHKGISHRSFKRSLYQELANFRSGHGSGQMTYAFSRHVQMRCDLLSWML